MKILIISLFVISVYAVCGMAMERFMCGNDKEATKECRVVAFFGWPVLAIVILCIAFFCLLAEIPNDLDCESILVRSTRPRKFRRKRILYPYHYRLNRFKRRRF